MKTFHNNMNMFQMSSKLKLNPEKYNKFKSTMAKVLPN